jgi:DNA-binding response OmpR family regulator
MSKIDKQFDAWLTKYIEDSCFTDGASLQIHLRRAWMAGALHRDVVGMTTKQAELMDMLKSEDRFFSTDELLMGIWGGFVSRQSVSSLVHTFREKYGRDIIVAQQPIGKKKNQAYKWIGNDKLA